MKFPIGRKTVFALVLALVALPVLSFADVFSCGSQFASACIPGTLHVYVMTQPNPEVAQALRPGDVNVTLHAQYPSELSFPGSLSGTNLSVVGSYRVDVQPVPNYTPSYSIGCTDSVSNRQEATCVITMSPMNAYFSYPQPYPYAYTNPTLDCMPAYQSVALGQTAVFTAVGGSGVYNWSTPGSSYQAIGPRFTMQPRVSGVQTVQVMNGTNIATCTLNVGAVQGPVVYSPYTAGTQSPVVYAPTYSVNTQGTVYATPALPNTGFEPVSATQYAFALVVLLAVGIFAAPYVRKTFSVVVG